MLSARPPARSWLRAGLVIAALALLITPLTEATGRSHRGGNQAVDEHEPHARMAPARDDGLMSPLDGADGTCTGSEFVYRYDDGTAEFGLRPEGTHGAWLNNFIVEGDGTVIEAIDLTFVNIAAGVPATVYLWSDPNGDGDPTDAQVLASAGVTTQGSVPNDVLRVNIADTYVGEAGTSFFVGAIIEYPTPIEEQFPAPMDASPPITLGVAWAVGKNGPIDPNDLSNGALEFSLLDTLFPPNVFELIVRAVTTASLDCNENGMPDQDDINGGTSLDCNFDCIPDECQIDGNDCNGNGVPDECDLGGPFVPQYVLDDGFGENAVGLTGAGDTAWLNHFTVQQNGEFIDSVQIAYGSVAEGTPVTVIIWLDPDGDGNPSDADVYAPVETTVESPGSDVFVTIDYSGLFIGPPGTSFFVGALLEQTAGESPARIDQTTDEGESWLAAGSGGVDPNNLDASALFGPIANLGFPGNWMVRAVPVAEPAPNDCNGNGVPDECDLGEGTDCDGNGVPDACQPEEDCDGNGLLEPCELTYTNGLVGHYWLGTDFALPAATRVDPTIDFDWGTGEPHPLLPVDGFSVRWTGLVLTPPVNGAYTFLAKADDGVRLWINGDLLIDEWHPSSGTEYAATVPLLGNTTHHVRLEYFEGGGDARVYLKWAPPGGVEEVIPTGALFVMQDCNGNDVPDACDIDAGTSDDLNGNGVPDECEDCNGNGVLDDLDISGGFSDDCNANGLPDECEVAGGGLNDCNGNGIPDDCELDEFDCDGNGIHDACEAIASGLVGHYYTNPIWAGPPAVSRVDATVDFPNDFTPPAPLGTDYFSVRWLGSLVSQAAGTYQLTVEHDDGFALYLDGVLLMSSSGSGTDSVSVDLGASTEHHIRLDYFENAGGQLCHLRWTPPGGSEEVVPTSALRPIYDANDNDLPDACDFGDCNGNGVPDDVDVASGGLDCDGNGVPDECQASCDCDGNGLLESCEAQFSNGLVGQYWSSAGGPGNFSQRLLVRVDPNIDFNWGDGSPDPIVPNEDFSVRWTGAITTPTAAGTYTFYTITDDGLRLWIDDQLLIDEWQAQSPTEHSGAIALAANTTYLVRMDYREDGGGAEARLEWEPPGSARAVIPTEALDPTADTDGDGIPDTCALVDCNDNGTPDLEDIALGFSEDCNGNCIPDECDIVVVPGYGQGHWRFEEPGGTTVLDSGPNALDGTLNALPTRTGDVPVDPVPQTALANTQSLALNWQSGTSGGFFTVPDTGGALSMGNQDFTIEAWVKLDHLSTTAGDNQRQFLCQKKTLPSQDGQIDYALLAQRGNNSGPSPNFGKTSGFSGRELQLYFGTGSGSSTWGVTSNLEINDLGWHFVSVAYDTTVNTVRFGIDGTFETILFNDNPHVTNSGPLRVGSHQNGVGTNNFFLRGTIDELRISRGVVPVAGLLNAAGTSFSEDANGDGIPDECAASCPADLDGSGDVGFGDILVIIGAWGPCGGCAEDLNGNGVVDFADILVVIGAWGPC